jgi:hypothetical protein
MARMIIECLEVAACFSTERNAVERSLCGWSLLRMLFRCQILRRDTADPWLMAGSRLRLARKTFPRKSIHTEISPLRFAPVEMTKGRAVMARSNA